MKTIKRMKKTRILIAAMLLLCAVVFCSCAEPKTTETDKMTDAVPDAGTQAQDSGTQPAGTDAPSTDAPSTDAPSTDAPTTDPSDTDTPSTDEPGDKPTVQSDVCGIWISPVSTDEKYTEVWVFATDGTYHIYAVDDDYAVVNAVDGTYKLGENNTLDVTVMGYTLSYTYLQPDKDTLVLSDHGTEETFTRSERSVTFPLPSVTLS